MIPPWKGMFLLVMLSVVLWLCCTAKRTSNRYMKSGLQEEGSGEDADTDNTRWPVLPSSRDQDADRSDNCHLPLRVGNRGLVPRYWLQASDGEAFRARLGEPTSWQPNKLLFPDAREQNVREYAWIQVDLDQPALMTGVQTQGHPLGHGWVTWYYVYYSHNCDSFHPLIDTDGLIARFHGNFDGNTVVTNYFHELVIARCLRIVPLRAHNNHTALRLEILGCDVGKCKEGVIRHLHGAKKIYQRPTSLSGFSQRSRSRSRSLRKLIGGRGGPPLTPTHELQSFAAFKFPAEQLLFGVVMFKVTDQKLDSAERFTVSYSRSCLHWEPIRQQQGYGDEMVFVLRLSQLDREWLAFPYPVRATCVRIIPVTHHNVLKNTVVRAHFMGCGTGPGIIHQCGSRKPLPPVSRPRRQKRVIGGQASHGPGLWPWLASIKLIEESSTRHVCGATLIHPQWLMTAAHCFAVMYSMIYGNATRNYILWNDAEFRSKVVITFGEFSLHVADGTEYIMAVEKIVGHPDYNMSYFIQDIALVKLLAPVRLTDHVNLMCIPESENQFPPGSVCQVVGWGNTGHGFPYRPHFASMPLLSATWCQYKYSHLTITRDMLCAGPEDGSTDACLGDSGGPLLCETTPGSDQWTQVGIASWNIGCGKAGYPGVYAKVETFTSWIFDIIDRH